MLQILCKQLNAQGPKSIGKNVKFMAVSRKSIQQSGHFEENKLEAFVW